VIGVYAYGWETPGCDPPGCNLPAPINAGLDPQTKAGNLTIQGNLTTGSFTMTAGAEADKVLTTNASGVATWQTAAGGGEAIPAGVIVMWSGTLAAIPTGWHLCDGVGGTPDLRDKFIYGASAGVNPGGTGGATTHAHTYNTVIAHTHTVSGTTNSTGDHWHDKNLYSGCWSNKSGTGTTTLCEVQHWSGYTMTGSAGAHSHTVSGTAASTGSASGTTAVGTHLPPYYKLAYIMKL